MPQALGFWRSTGGVATAFAQDDAESARTQWHKVADKLRSKPPKLAGFLNEAETDVLAYMTFPPQRWTELIGIFPNEDAIVRLNVTILLEQNDE
jgi:putative transposase